MGRRPEQTLSQTGPADGQQAHEKMLNIAGPQGAINQNHNKISPHTVRMAVIKKTRDVLIRMWRKEVGLYWRECKLVQPLQKTL